MNDADIVINALYTSPDDFPLEKRHSKAEDAVIRMKKELAVLRGVDTDLVEARREVERLTEENKQLYALAKERLTKKKELAEELETWKASAEATSTALQREEDEVERLRNVIEDYYDGVVPRRLQRALEGSE